ncbi:ATP-binding protein [Amycolatopsis pigmentata]|uniref:ATP-binding protein n=1 Tax=Amycolatopsis pigmentata TaxID=450801 RepID=A0ABW5FMZ2_9PSEU
MCAQRAARPAGNLPAFGSTFVGRHRELAEVKRQLERSRLLTLTGPGGVGKTRLALQAGLFTGRAFADGVWVVDLAALENSLRLGDTVAATLGVPDRSVRPAFDQLADHLAHRSILLILDNCEHLVQASAELVDGLLHRAPGLHVLATSRQALRLADEHILIVDPLPVPDPHDSPPVAILAGYSSIALLVDRASAVRPGFTVHEGNREAAARLCARLDGLPLAIELAATRLRSLSVEQVADRLDDRFRLLNRGSPAARPRQQTLRALMDWSYDLCSPQERQLWARLSVFPGDFDLSAAEATCSGPGLPRESIIDVLDDLVAKSVVSVRPRSPAARYHMLETVRQYGRERLNRDGLGRVVQRRHRDYYLRLAVDCCDRWCGPDQADLLSTMRLDHDNLMTALEWSLTEKGESRAALKMVSALRYHWVLNYPATGRRRFDQVLGKAREPSRERGEALWVAAWIARIQGDIPTSAKWRRECAEIADRYHDEHLHAYTRLLTGSMALFTGDPAEAAQHLEASLFLLRELQDTPMVLMGLFLHGAALTLCGDSAAAQAACAQAIALAEEHGERWARSEAIWILGFHLWSSGDANATAADLAREALALTPDVSSTSTVLAIELLAWIVGSQGAHEHAARLLGAATAQWQSLGTDLATAFPPYARYTKACRAAAITALGQDGFRSHFDDGKARPYDTQERTEPENAGKTGGPRLTRREGEVATLIARGYTNKAIAAELVLSPHTVGGHVERLFAKLGVTTRAQVATWLAEHRDQAADLARRPGTERPDASPMAGSGSGTGAFTPSPRRTGMSSSS